VAWSLGTRIIRDVSESLEQDASAEPIKMTAANKRDKRG